MGCVGCHNFHKIISNLAVVARSFAGSFPELPAQEGTIRAIVAEEEQSFSKMLERGIKYLQETAEEQTSRGSTAIPGDKVTRQTLSYYMHYYYIIDASYQGVYRRQTLLCYALSHSSGSVTFTTAA
jgi:tRNA synthetases class II (A)